MDIAALMKNDFFNWLPTIICVGIMLIWIFRSWKKFKDKVHADPFEEYDEPGTATGLGILGTFFGITFGMAFFDTGDVIKSVPPLLAGMKTAFVTSIVGMLTNFWFKYYQHKAQNTYYNNVKYAKPQKSPANVATLIAYLKKRDEENEARMSHLMGFMRETNESLGENLTASIQEMTDSIVGSGEHTLNSEIQRGFERTCDTLDSFQLDFLKKQTKQFAAAMNFVVKNFNENLENQCAESFKELNQAVGELTKLQQEYMDKLKQVGDQQTDFAEKIAAISTALAGVQTAVEDLGSKSKSLQEVSNLAQQDYNMIQKSMTEIVSSVEKFEGSAQMIADLKTNMDTAASEMQQLTKEQHDAMVTELTNMKEALRTTVDDWTQMSKDAQDDVIEANKKQQEAFEQALAQEIEDLGEALRKQNGEKADALNQDIIKSLNETNEKIRDISAKMTEDLNKRVNESLQSLGSALAQISEKFAADYTPLAEKLEEVTLLANKLQLSQQKGSTKA